MPPSAVPAVCSTVPDVALLAKRAATLRCKVGVRQQAEQQYVRPEGHGRSVVQCTGNSCRLLTLPAATLYDIARRAGPRARRLCRALRDAFGPLDQGLHLSTATCPDTALSILTTHQPRLRHATHLTLPPMPHDGARPLEALLPAICTALPSLTRLTLPPDRPLTNHHLALLSPLAPRLTHLHAQLLSASCPTRTPLHPLPLFTQLASLTLACHAPPPGPETRAWLTSLSALPHLTHLSLFHLPDPTPLQGCNTDPAPHPPFTRLTTATPHAFDSSWLPGLATATPHLRSLSLGALPVAWNPAAATALTHGFPHLTHLSLMHTLAPPAPSHPAPHPPPPAPPPGPLAALAQRPTPLKSTHLQLYGAASTTPPAPPLAGGWGPGYDEPDDTVEDPPQVPQLSRLAAVLEGFSGRQAAWVWEALQHQTGLTCLQVSCSGVQLPGSFLRLTTLPSLAASLTDLQLGWHWDPAQLVACLLRLTRLRTLGLHRDEFMSSSSRWPPEAVSKLALLTHLESLAITEQMLPPKLLHSIAHLTRLRELTLTESTDCLPRPMTVSDADLGHLRPLGGCLTSLELAGISGVRGGGLTTLRELTQLQRLKLRALRMLDRHDVHRFLLPLPPALSVLHMLDVSVATSPRSSLVAAAHRQDGQATISSRHRR